MDESTHVLSNDSSTAKELPVGARVGAWRVLKVIGRGGMGEVYLAERADASFDKQVALKLVQGALTPTARARFDAEKQALARLEHTHIARLIDAGETDAGWPYLVMEYVAGEPIDRHLAGRSVEAVLNTFLQVCDALDYAHRQLVLHRDIKPSNILVDGEGDAKLLDFGIAKLLRSTEGAEDSQTVERAYTPEFASPEQVFGRPIGVASDIYSLGVLLYRLLTGSPPYRIDAGDTRALVRALSEDDVPAPSRVVLATTTGTGGERRKLARRLAGDLDTIVLTALKKHPERRYASVEAFAEDIRRFFANEPIRAQPDSLGYRARKFLLRNAIGVAAAVAVALALVGGLAASVWQARIAERERAQAEQRFEDVRGLAHAMIFDLHDELAKVPGTTKARAMLVQNALTYLRKLGTGDDAPAPLRLELAQAWMRVADVQGGGGTNLGDVKGALASYAQALKQAEGALRLTPNDLGAQRAHAQILLHQAEALYQSNALADAEHAYRQALAECTAIAAKGDPKDVTGVAEAQDGLGDVAYWTNNVDAALRWYVQAQATMERVGPRDNPRSYELFIAQIQNQRGYAEIWRGHPEQARELFRQSIARLQTYLQKYPDDQSALHLLVASWMQLGESMEDMADKQPMLDAFNQSRELLARMSASDAADVKARSQLAVADQRIGDALYAMKRYDEALASYTKALGVEQAIVAHDPGDATTRGELANTWYDIGFARRDLGDKAGAIAALRESLALRQAMLAQDPSAGALRRDVASAEGDLGDLVADLAEACRLHLASDAIWQQLVRAGSASPQDKDSIELVHKQAAACPADRAAAK